LRKTRCAGDRCELSRRDWKYTRNYADAKTAVVEEIIARARESDDGVDRA